MFYINNCPVCGSIDVKYNQALVMPFVSERTGAWIPYKVTKEEFKDLEPGYSYQSTYTSECCNCGLVYSKHRFTNDEISKLYLGYRDKHYVAQRLRYEPNYNDVDLYLKSRVAHLDDVESRIRSYKDKIKSILDWGGGEGLNTPMINSAEYVCVYDVSQDNKIKSIAGDKFNYKDGFDLLVCMHVLEHVNSPVLLLQELLKHGKKGSLVYIEVPLEKEINAEHGGIKKGRRKTHWHEHINFFSIRSMNAMLGRCNLEVMSLITKDVSDNFRNFMILQAYARII